MVTIGRIIHVRGYTRCYPAMVTLVTDDGIYCTIFEPLKEATLSGLIKQGRGIDEWHWPDECEATKVDAPAQARRGAKAQEGSIPSSRTGIGGRVEPATEEMRPGSFTWHYDSSLGIMTLTWR